MPSRWKWETIELHDADTMRFFQTMQSVPGHYADAQTTGYRFFDRFIAAKLKPHIRLETHFAKVLVHRHARP